MKPNINTNLARQLVVEQFPEWAYLPIKPVEYSGHDNRTFHLGREMSMRLPSNESYVAQVEKEQRWLPHLAKSLNLPIPEPLALGQPNKVYPWNWSIYGWLEGQSANIVQVDNLEEFARSLAAFLAALQQIDTVDGPPPGPHNHFRGAAPEVYDQQTRDTIIKLEGYIDASAATEVWNTALSSRWERKPVWVHGDVSSGNMLAKDGELSAVIDFGCCGVGDPACDLAIAWTYFSGDSRAAFRENMSLDEATWQRARGWALWKALITIAYSRHSDPAKAKAANHVATEVIAEHQSSLRR